MQSQRSLALWVGISFVSFNEYKYLVYQLSEIFISNAYSQVKE